MFNRRSKEAQIKQLILLQNNGSKEGNMHEIFCTDVCHFEALLRNLNQR